MAKTQIMVKEERVQKYMQDPTDENFFLAVLGILNLNPLKDGQNAYNAFRDFQDAIMKRESPNQNHVKILDEAITSSQEQTPSQFNLANMTGADSKSRFTSSDPTKHEGEKPHAPHVTQGFQI